MTSRRWLLLSGAAVLASALIGPRVVPLYDGVGFPDEPYRYVDQSNPLADSSVLDATSAKGTFSASDLIDGVSISTGETGPQFELTLSPKAVSLANDTGKITIKAVPLAASDQPKPGTIAGNVYEVTAAAQSGQPKFNPSYGELFLRLPQGIRLTGTVAIVYRTPGGKWVSVVTSQAGNDIYESAFKGPGDYAMAKDVPLASPPPDQNSSIGTSNNKSSSPAKYALVGLLGLAIALFILGIRRLGPGAGNGREKNRDDQRTNKH